MEALVLEYKYKIAVPIFGAAYAASNKGTTLLYRFRSLSAVLSPLQKIEEFKDFSRHLSVFQVLFKANLIFKDFSRLLYIQVLFKPCKPCGANHKSS